VTLAAIVLATSIDAIFRDYDGAVPGASVLVVRNGEVLFRKSYGLAEVEAGTKAAPETNYRLASMTKQFTAMSILTLAHRGKLSLDDRITKFFPEFPEHGITVKQMLTHSSGLVDYEDVMPAGLTIPLKDFDVLWILQQQEKTLFPPGSKYQYSNSGYALLALIVEKVSGQTFARFLHDTLFVPAGMTHTLAYEKGISTVAHRAYGYSRDESGWKRTDQSLTSAVLGDGGIYSSIDDLARWYAWLDKSPLYKEASQRRFEDYGYGWFVKDGEVWHTGETMGFRNAVLRVPAEHLTIVVLTNRNEGHPIELARSIAGAMRH
jgi:CubicO group peptidase (beta-lactamase class C family)